MNRTLPLLGILTLLFFGAGCVKMTEPEQEQETPAQAQDTLYNVANVHEANPNEGILPGYWTFTITSSQGELDANLAIYDDGTAQGIFGEARSPQTGSRKIAYGSDSYGTWEIDGDMVLFSGGSIEPFKGMILDETSMTGTLKDTSGQGLAWTATKTGELDRVLEMAGNWMLNFTVNGQERFEEIQCAPNGLCEVVWEKYPGQYEGAPSEPRFYTYHHQGGYNFQLESTDGSLSHDLTAHWEDYWGGWEAEGTATNNGDGSSDVSQGIKMSD